MVLAVPGVERQHAVFLSGVAPVTVFRDSPLRERIGVALPAAGRYAGGAEIVELIDEAERLHQTARYFARRGDAPVAERHLRVGRELVRLHRARFDAELHAAGVEVQPAVEPRLGDVGGLRLIIDAQILRAERAQREGEVRIAAGRRHRAGRAREDRAIGEPEPHVVEVERLLDAVRAVVAAGRRARARDAGGEAHQRLAATGDRVVRQAARLRIVDVEAQIEAVGHLPGRIEARGLQVVLLLAVLLLEAEVLRGAFVLLQKRGRRDDLAGVEHDLIEVVGVHPERLVAAIFLQLALRERVVGGQPQALDRLELDRQLPVDALTLAIREVIPDVVRNRVERAFSGRVLDGRAGCELRGQLGPIVGPRADVPVVDRGHR